MDLIYWSVRSSSRRGGDGVKGVDVEYDYFNDFYWVLIKLTYLKVII